MLTTSINIEQIDELQTSDIGKVVYNWTGQPFRIMEIRDEEYAVLMPLTPKLRVKSGACSQVAQIPAPVGRELHLQYFAEAPAVNGQNEY